MMPNTRSISQLDRIFDILRAAPEPGRHLLVQGTLDAGRPHPESIPSAFRRAAGTWRGRPLLAFQASGTSLAKHGVRTGDFLLVEPRDDLRTGETILTDIDGTLAVQRVVRDAAQEGLRLEGDAGGHEALGAVRVYGVVRGIVGRRGRPAVGADRSTSRAKPSPSVPSTPASFEAELPLSHRDGKNGRLAGTLRALDSRLLALRSTYLSTQNPRLRHALVDEGKKLRRELGRLQRLQRSS